MEAYDALLDGQEESALIKYLELAEMVGLLHHDVGLLGLTLSVLPLAFPSLRHVPLRDTRWPSGMLHGC